MIQYFFLIRKETNKIINIIKSKQFQISSILIGILIVKIVVIKDIENKIQKFQFNCLLVNFSYGKKIGNRI